MARLAPKLRQISEGTVVPLAPPPIIGLGSGGGFTYVLQDQRGGDTAALAQATRGLIVAANQNPQPEPGVHHLLGDQSVDLSRYRPRQGADPGRAAEQRVPGAAGLARRLLRQLHEPVRPHLAGAGAGGGRGSRADRRHLPDQRAQQRRQDDPDAQPCRGAHRGRRAGHHPLQQPAGRHHPGQPRAGRLLRAGAEGDGGGRGPHAAARLWRRMDRHRVPGEARRGPDRG